MKRGEIWSVRFDPSVGDEIQKLRPAVIISVSGAFRHRLQIVVPITSWQNVFRSDFWMIRLPADAMTGLTNESAANTFQVKSVSVQRFTNPIGRVSDQHLTDITSAIALLIGFNPT
jgi:mRNA interferase MazF